MKKLISSLAILTLTIGATSSTVVACGSGTTQAQQEANKLDNKSITLNDTSKSTYEGQTAQGDMKAIDNAIVQDGYVTAAEAKDFIFNKTTKLKTGDNNKVSYNVTAPNGSTASGTFDIKVHQPLQVGPIILNPSTPSKGQAEANEIKNKTFTLNDTSTTTYEGKTAEQDIQAIDRAISQQTSLTMKQLQGLSFPNAKSLVSGDNYNLAFNIKADDGTTGSGTINILINPYKPTPPHTSQAQKEANEVNDQSITLNDTSTTTYEGQTAQADAAVIQAAIAKLPNMDATQAKDFTFNNTTKLTTGDNKGISFNVKAPDGSTASGSFNVTINHPASKIVPGTPSTGQTEANKVNGKSITLNDTSTTTYEGKTTQADVSAVDVALVKAGYITTTEAKDFSFDNTKNLTTGDNTGINFNVKAPDGSSGSGTFNVTINPYSPTPPPPTPGGGLGKSKSVPFLDVTSVASGTNDLTPDKVYNTFGVHQVMLAFVSAYDNSGASWVQGVKFDDMNTAEAKWIQQYEALGGSVGISFGGAVSSGAGNSMGQILHKSNNEYAWYGRQQISCESDWLWYWATRTFWYD